jgi:signal transduction histidine kinase
MALAGAALGIVVALALLIGGRAVQRTADARNDLVDSLYPAEAATLRLTNAFVNEESGVRGFALTGNDAFLEPYVEGRREQSRALARLEGLAQRSPETSLGADLATIRERADAWRSAYAEPLIREVQAGDPATRAEADEGKARFDALRGALRDLELEIIRAREAGRARLEDSARALTLSLVAVGVAVVLAILVLILWLRRAISRPLDRLGSEVRLVAQGDVHHEVAASGPVDIAQLGADVESMRLRIVRELSAVEESREELRRSNAELEQFAYVASHDLQEPLRKVASFCQLLQRRYSGQLDERADQYIEFAVDGAKRMQALINDLLSFSRVGRTELGLAPVDLDDALGDALDNLARRIEDTGGTITAEPLPTVLGERPLLAAVFQNLVGNALKFHGETSPVVRVEVRQDGNSWAVAVSDRGIGIEPQYAERIFAIFQRLHTKEAYEGTGIGLALTRKIIEHHGGRIWLDTDVEQGATFRFTLPVAQEATT